MMPKQAATMLRPAAGCDAPGLRDERRGWKEWARSLSKFFTFIDLYLEALNFARSLGGFLWVASWLNFAPKQPEKAIKMRFLVCNAVGAAKRGLRGGAGGL
jgi:hypothetical protein